MSKRVSYEEKIRIVKAYVEGEGGAAALLPPIKYFSAFSLPS